MTTLIAVYNSDGCVGRCDARCYNAKGGPCRCICGGANHGGGLDQGIENNYHRVGLTHEDLERFASQHERNPADLFVVDRVAVKSNYRARRIARQALTEPEPPLEGGSGRIYTPDRERRRA